MRRALLQPVGLLHRQLHHLGVVLGDLVELADRRADLCQAGALLRTGGRDRRQVGGHAAHTVDDAAHALARVADLRGTAFHLRTRGLDESADLARRGSRTLGQRANLTGYHREAAALLARTGRFHGGVEREDVGLEGQAVDDADDLVHLRGTFLDAFDRLHGLVHGARAALGHVAHLRGLAVGIARGLRVLSHRAGELLHAGRGLFEVGRLLLGAVGKVPVAHGQAAAGVRHQGGIAAHLGHHGREAADHAVQQARELGQFVTAIHAKLRAQVAARRLAHGV